MYVKCKMKSVCVTPGNKCTQGVLLVIQNDVWSPNKIAGYSNDLKSIILIFIPAQVSIMPNLTHPQVCGQHLVPFILEQRIKHKATLTTV